MLRSLGFWAAAGFLLAARGLLPAEASAPSAPAAWVQVLAADREGEAFRPVVEEALRYRLERQGLSVRLRGSPAGVSPAGLSPASATSLLEGASRAGADFALECRYSGSGSRLAISLDWYDVPPGLLLAAVDRKGRVDLELDSIILDALDELLARVRERIDERIAASGFRPASPGRAAPAGVPGTAGPAQTRPDSGSPAEGPASGLPAAGPLPQTGTLPGEVVPPAAGRYEGARLLLAPTLAPFVAVGAASYYFPVGFQSTLQVDFLPRGARGRLGLGGLAGVTVFQAQGVTEESLGFLVPLGVSLRYSLELGERWGLLFHLGAGPALLAMGTESQGALAKVLPFVRSGVGAELALGRRVSLGLEAAYEVYFETPYLIMGFAPGLCFSWRM